MFYDTALTGFIQNISPNLPAGHTPPFTIKCLSVSTLPIVTGLGLATVLGDSAQTTWSALLTGRAVADHTRISGIESSDRVSTLACNVAFQAITHARWDSAILRDSATGLVVGTSKGPIESWLTPAGGTCQFGLSAPAQKIACKLNFGAGPRLTLSAAFASGLHALIRAAFLLARSECRRVLVVAAEASVHPLFIGGFQRLGVLAPEGYGCRPFDKQRRGFVMTEAAAAVCLESHESSNASPIARLERFAWGADAHHLTAGNPDSRALRHLLARVIDRQPVDLIHAHGTGTIQNDPAELAALESVLAGDDRPILYSHKAALGHSQGAAGLVSVVLNCLSHQSQIAAPNIRTTDPLPTRFRIPQTPCRAPIRRSIAIASGFGGPLAAVSLISP